MSVQLIISGDTINDKCAFVLRPMGEAKGEIRTQNHTIIKRMHYRFGTAKRRYCINQSATCTLITYHVRRSLEVISQYADTKRTSDISSANSGRNGPKRRDDRARIRPKAGLVARDAPCEPRSLQTQRIEWYRICCNTMSSSLVKQERKR